MRISNPALSRLAVRGCRAFGILCLCLPGVSPADAAVQATIYVAPNGRDLNSGQTPASAVATLARARDLVRAINAHQTGDIVVAIAKGDYPVKETVAFAEQDSGSNGFKVIYRNLDAVGTARFIGGTKVTGWTAYQGPIFRANIGPGLKFTTLYENGIRADMARWPKRTSSFATSRAGYMLYEDTKNGLLYSDHAYSPAGTPFDPAGKDFRDAWVYAWQGNDGHRWCSATTGVTSVANGRIGIKNCGLGWPPDSFLIEGSQGLLTRPGEFFYDPAAGILYYYSRFNGSIDKQEIIAPEVVRLLQVTGASADSRVQNLEFSGLVFTGTDRIAQSSEDDWGDEQQSSWDSAVYVKNAQNVTLLNCKVADTGMSGVTFDANTEACAVNGCLIEHTGYHGISFKGGANDVAHDCLIRYAGELRGHGDGVSIMKGTHALSNLEIYDVARAGLAIRGQGDTIKYVKVHDCVQDSGDQGGIYLVDPAADTRFEQCTSFHNYVDLSCMDRPPTAIYNDRDATNTVWSNIDCGDSQMYNFRHDPQAKGTLTFDNVSWLLDFHPRSNEATDKPNPSFDRSRMEYAKIGLTPEFPPEYNDLAARPAAPLNVWTHAGNGEATLHWTQADRAATYTIRRALTGQPYAIVATRPVPATGPDQGTSYTDVRLANGTPYYYLVTASNKAGESGFSLPVKVTPDRQGSNKLTGTPIGVGPAIAAATDGNLTTCYENGSGWVGLDLGSPRVITEVRYAPRSDNTDTTAKLCGGEFQGSADADFAHPTTFYKVVATKGGAGVPVLIPQTIYVPAPFRYVRYIGPNGKCTIAEMEFYGHTAN
jgi:hypothetical protein